MTKERYRELEDMTKPAQLTEAEVAEGWHWCMEWDDMLVGPEMKDEYALCNEYCGNPLHRKAPNDEQE